MLRSQDELNTTSTSWIPWIGYGWKNARPSSSVRDSWSCLSDLWDSQSTANPITVQCKECKWYFTKLCCNMNLAMCNLPSNMKSSSHKTWQASLLFLKPLQIQNLKRKKWGDMAIYIPPPSKEVGGHGERVPHQISRFRTVRRRAVSAMVVANVLCEKMSVFEILWRLDYKGCLLHKCFCCHPDGQWRVFPVRQDFSFSI